MHYGLIVLDNRVPNIDHTCSMSPVYEVFRKHLRQDVTWFSSWPFEPKAVPGASYRNGA